ncbi:unnamed protein product [Plutella xylostella]|uniref:rRNA 2'-O-methyltransferase fibrillarin n=1 Tax=Plutella xylostella TaxID=51655 RepID=A0A8S4GB88_PLUXY|nr:unnamed protein product [Plutella xylostella]
MDGLILNTEDLYTVAFQNILSRYGKEYSYELKRSLMGSQSHETADRIIEALNLPMTREEFLEESKKQFELLFPDTKVLPGARRLIEHLHKHNIPIGLATSSSIDSYHLKIDKHHKELFSLFPHKTFGSSDPAVKKGKPHPDIFLVAASKFPDQPKPEKCLVFEDAENGVKAAKAAGMQVVMPRGRWPRRRRRGFGGGRGGGAAEAEVGFGAAAGASAAAMEAASRREEVAAAAALEAVGVEVVVVARPEAVEAPVEASREANKSLLNLTGQFNEPFPKRIGMIALCRNQVKIVPKNLNNTDGDKVEYRVWNPFRSKLAAAIMGGVDSIHMPPGSRVLYLGAASGTTVSHVSDIVGPEGLVYAVEFSHRSGRDLINVAKKRTNIIPIIEDARHPLKYRMLVGMVDTIFADVAQPDQARIVSLNAQHFLKNGGHFVISIKASCIDSTAQPEAVFAAEVKKLQADKLKPQEQLTLEPYERDHAVVVGVFRPPPKKA